MEDPGVRNSNSPAVVFYAGGPSPAWLDQNAWAIPVQVSQETVNKMPRIAMHKVELKVHMCCSKCAEIVSEEIRYLGGVFNVDVDQKNNKVTVMGRPDPDRVLRRAKRVDRHATFWPPAPPPPVVEVVVVEEKKVEETKKDEKVDEKKEEKKVEKKAETKDEKKEEKKETEETKKEEKKEETKEEKKQEKKEEPKKEEAVVPPANVAQSQYPPFQSIYEGYPPYGYGHGYRPSQSYQPLYPEYNMGMFGPQVPYLNPNYLKHVKIAY